MLSHDAFFYVIKNKYLIIISLLSWANIGFLYVLHLNETYTTLIGVLNHSLQCHLFYVAHYFQSGC